MKVKDIFFIFTKDFIEQNVVLFYHLLQFFRQLNNSIFPKLFFFFLILFKFLFVFGCVGSSLLLGLFSSYCEWGLLFFAVCSFSLRWLLLLWTRALGSVGSVAAAPGLQSTGSVVMGNGLSCSLVCGIFLDQESNLCFLYWQADSLPLSHQGSPITEF